MKQNEYSYKVGGQENFLNLDTDHITLKFEELVRGANFVASNNHPGEFKDPLEFSGEKYTVFNLDEV